MATISTNTFTTVPTSSKTSGQFKPTSKRRSSVTNTTHRSSLLTDCIDGNSLGSAISEDEMRGNVHVYNEGNLPDVHVLRRSANEGTAPTMFSTVSRSDRSSNRSHLRREASATSRNMPSFLRFLAPNRRRKKLSEDQLRKQIKRHCENRDWPKVRRLISNHDFTEVPEVVLETNSLAAKSSSSEGKQSQNKEHVQTSRRPSYGSRNGERLSFTGKESSAAADAMKVAAAMALLEESSSSEECSRTVEVVRDENILHDVCSHNPPRDVIEMLLAVMRHRKGSTCGRDEKGRTPLHVAVATGASPGVIDALTRADPLPATMGDHDKRSPLHLAVKYLAYEERYDCPEPQNNSKRALFKLKKSSNSSTSYPILSREQAIEDTRQIVVILKNAMMTYPGQIDFKDEDEAGFAPLDYAIDGAINDRTILRTLIRRDRSQDIRRRFTYQSQESDMTPKTRNCTDQLTKQLSDKTISSLNRRRRRSTHSGSSVSTRDSLISQDIDVVHQIEEEEIETRRHRIDRINARKKKKRMQNRLLDVFGIEEEEAMAEAAGQPLPESPEKLNDHKSLISNDSSNSRVSSKSNDPHVQSEEVVADTPLAHQEPKVAQLTEQEMYTRHLQAYLEDNMDEEIGDLEYCDDISFLLRDPDEIEADPVEEVEHNDCSARGENDILLMFEVCVTHENDASHFDECSDISLT
jgi:hypothetical protein